MSNNKQSSIEWLEDKLTGFLTFEDMEAVKNYDNLIKQAKAMHKEEIEKAFDRGGEIGVDIGSNHDWHEGHNQGHQYYKETFKDESN